MYDTRRTVTWECYVLALNGFHERVLRSSRYPLIALTRNQIFAGKVPFPRAGHIYICSAQFVNLRNFEIAPHKLEISNLRNYL